VFGKRLAPAFADLRPSRIQFGGLHLHEVKAPIGPARLRDKGEIGGIVEQRTIRRWISQVEAATSYLQGRVQHG
jgi:hypothetical protein